MDATHTRTQQTEKKRGGKQNKKERMGKKTQTKHAHTRTPLIISLLLEGKRGEGKSKEEMGKTRKRREEMTFFTRCRLFSEWDPNDRGGYRGKTPNRNEEERNESKRFWHESGLYDFSEACRTSPRRLFFLPSPSPRFLSTHKHNSTILSARSNQDRKSTDATRHCSTLSPA